MSPMAPDYEHFELWLPQDDRVFNVFLREGPMTTIECAARLGRKAGSTGANVDTLVEAGMLRAIGIVRGKGRPSKRYDVRGR